MLESADSTLETKAEAQTSPASVWRLWMDAIELASKEEEDWRKSAETVQQIYANSQKEEKNRKKFNILYANTETIVPAVYNSTPIPDVRRRFGDDDADSKVVSQVIERCISCATDTTSFDSTLNASVLDATLPGRGLCRVQYEAKTSELGITYQRTYIQHVQWDDFRHGPAKEWDAVPWEAFRHRMTREQLVALSPEIGPNVQLDSMLSGLDKSKSKDTPDQFKRAIVWEIWDKETKQVLFLAESYHDSPLAILPPPIALEGFYPNPKPLQFLLRTDSLVPLELYRFYQSQADELDDITQRLTKLVKVMRWRGIRSTALGDAFERIKDLYDGQLAPAENAMEVMQSQGGMDAAIWMMPIEKLVPVIQELSAHRERVKQTVYEITGIADIMRGQTAASETLGAQKIKAQWGSMRVQNAQKTVQQYARDIFRVMAEIIANAYTPDVINMMTGIVMTPQQVALMRNDIVREYKIDVETDSTIRADVSQAQQNVGQFIQGLGQFVQAVGPLVQQGAMPPDVAIEMMVSFSRAFKLGKQVEDALDQWKQRVSAMAQQQASQPPIGGMPQHGAPQLQVIPGGAPQIPPYGGAV